MFFVLAASLRCKQSFADPTFLEMALLFRIRNTTVVLFGLTHIRLSGVFQVRIHARNLCGLGEGSELSVEVGGDLPFMPKERDEISAETFLQKYATFLAEFFFCSDHNDSPKVSVHIYLTQYSCLCP